MGGSSALRAGAAGGVDRSADPLQPDLDGLLGIPPLSARAPWSAWTCCTAGARRTKRVLDWVVCLAALALIAVIVWWGWDYAKRGSVQTMIGLEGVSMFWAYLAMPVGGLFCALGIVGNLLDPQRALNWRPRNDVP